MSQITLPKAIGCILRTMRLRMGHPRSLAGSRSRQIQIDRIESGVSVTIQNLEWYCGLLKIKPSIVISIAEVAKELQSEEVICLELAELIHNKMFENIPGYDEFYRNQNACNLGVAINQITYLPVRWT